MAQKFQKKIREIDKTVVLIFVTNLSQYAVNGYEVEALDYIVKPISYFNFSIKIQRAINRLNNTFDIKINIKTKDKIEIVSCKDIMYVEVFDNKLVIHMTTKIIETIGHLYEIEQKLANGYISIIPTPEAITIGDRTYSFEDQWGNLKIVINNAN